MARDSATKNTSPEERKKAREFGGEGNTKVSIIGLKQER